MYFQPIATLWARVFGLILLLAALGLAAVLVTGAIDLVTRPEAWRSLTSSSAISALIVLVLGGFCAQAGYRLALNRPDRNGTLFSRAGWIAMGTGLVTMAGLMTLAVLSVRRPDGNDILVIVALAAFGTWCFVLAWRRVPAPPGTQSR